MSFLSLFHFLSIFQLFSHTPFRSLNSLLHFDPDRELNTRGLSRPFRGKSAVLLSNHRTCSHAGTKQKERKSSKMEGACSMAKSYVEHVSFCH